MGRMTQPDRQADDAAAAVTVERRGPIAVVTLNRPSRKNALNAEMWAMLGRAADALHEKLPRAVVLTGAGSAFSAGMDVSPDNPQVAGIISAVATHDPEPVRAMLAGIHRVLTRFFALPVPIIAALGGLAYGGGAEIAARCDLRIADPGAAICFSEVRLGLMPDLGGGVALARLLGPSRAAELILTARKLKAEEALRIGLVNQVSAPGESVLAAVALAEEIAANGPRAVRGALAVLRQASGLAFSDALAFELDTAIDLIASGECQAGIAAFLTRTPPVFPDVPDLPADSGS